jgi:hypothetical protein
MSLMKKTARCLSLLLVFASASVAQSIDTLWTRTYWNGYNDSANCVQETSDRGFVIVGSAHLEGHADRDIFLIKTDSLGNEEWSTVIGDGHNECGYHVLEDYDGGYLISAQSDVIAAGSGGVWVVKTDSAGDTVWTHAWCPDERNAFPMHACYTADSGYAITGVINLSTNYNQAFILRLNRDGDITGSGDYGPDFQYQDGRFITQMPDSGFLVSGHLQDIYSSDYDPWVFRTDKYLEMIWDSTYVLSDSYDEAPGVCLAEDGLIQVGLSRGVGYVRKVDFGGHTLWTKPMSKTPYDEWYRTVCPTGDGGFMVGGISSVAYRYREFCFIRLDADGDTLWSFTVGGSENDHGRSIVPTYDGGYAMVGTSASFYNGTCVYLVKIGSDNCCEERVGDANGLGAYPDEITLGDIMIIVDAKFISASCDNITCLREADVNQSGGSEPTCEDITLLDIMFLVDFLFVNPGTAVLPDCL